MSDKNPGNESSNEAKPVEESSEIAPGTQDNENDEKMGISKLITNSLLTQSDAKGSDSPPMINSPRTEPKPTIKSRQGSLVSFNLPPNTTGAPVENQIEEFMQNNHHAVSPTNELNEEYSPQPQESPQRSARRSSFEAIPFVEVGEEKDEEKDEKIIDEKHDISPQVGESPKDLPSEEMEVEPEEYHPISPQVPTPTGNNVPIPFTEDMVPSAPNELKNSGRSTFEPIEFYGDENEIDESESEGSAFGPIQPRANAMIGTNCDDYSPNSMETNEGDDHQIRTLEMNDYQEEYPIKENEYHPVTIKDDEYSVRTRELNESPVVTREICDYQEQEREMSEEEPRDYPVKTYDMNDYQEDYSSKADNNFSKTMDYSYDNQRRHPMKTNNAKQKTQPIRTSENQRSKSATSRERPKISRIPMEKLSAQSEEAEEAIKNFSHTGRLPSTKIRQKFVSQLEKDKVDALERDDFDRYCNLEVLSQRANEKMATEQCKEMKKEHIAQLKEKLRQANDDYREFNKEWKVKIKEAEAQCKERIEKVIENQDEELDEFDRKWNDENYLSRFSKPSPLLLQLKARERSVVLAKMFDQANEIRKQAAFIEAEDTRNAQKRAIAEMKMQKKNMLKRHDEELVVMNNKCIEQINVLKRQKTVEEVPYVKRIRKVEEQLNSVRRCETIQTKQINMMQTGGMHSSRNTTERDLPSVRATSRIIISRRSDLPPKLPIKPLGCVTSRERKQRTIRIKAASSLK